MMPGIVLREPIKLFRIKGNVAMNRATASRTTCSVLVCCLSAVFSEGATIDQQDQQEQQEQKVPQSALLTKSATAVGYEVGKGDTKVDLNGTELMQATGWAKVEIKAKAGRTNIEVEVKGLKPPSTLG